MNRTARWTVPLLVAAGCTVAWWLWSRRESPPPMRKVAFDNRYGAASLLVRVSVDGDPARTLTADCDQTTCIFSLPLSNARHTLAVSVGQHGEWSEQATLNVDTSRMP